MKIAVCIKQVVTREWQVRVNDDKTWVRDADASWELNEPDAYALEEGLRLKEKHGGVDIVVHNAGITRDKSLRNMSLQQWRQVLQVDFGALVRLHSKGVLRIAADLPLRGHFLGGQPHAVGNANVLVIQIHGW